MKKTIFFMSILMLASLSNPALANKPSVTILEPKFLENGQAIVTCTVRHEGNNFLHHAQWLRVVVNGKEAARWEFSWKNNPESEMFTREAAIDGSGPLIIEAESNCNIHGSRGPSKITLVPPDKKK